VNRLNIWIEISSLLTEERSNIGQFCLQGVKGIKSEFYGARKGTDMSHKESDFTEPLFDIPYTNSVIKDLGLHRTRVMILKPKSCLTYHTDPSWRVHIPLITNEKCFFLENMEARHLEADTVHVVDTTQPHTSINASREERVHIVGVI